MKHGAIYLAKNKKYNPFEQQVKCESVKYTVQEIENELCNTLLVLMTVIPWKRPGLKMLIEQWKIRKGGLKRKQAFHNFLKTVKH